MAFIDAYHPVCKMTEGVQTVSSLLQRSEGNVLVVWDPEGTGSTVLINPMQVKSQIEVSFIGYMEAAQKRGKEEVKSLFRTHTHKYRSNICRACIINYSYFGLYDILIMDRTHANCTPTKTVTMCCSHNCKYGFVISDNTVVRVTVLLLLLQLLPELPELLLPELSLQQHQFR